MSHAPGNGDIAVVFVHGLGGHPTKSFTNPDTGATWFDLLRSERELDSSGRTGTSVYIYSVDYADAADGELSIEDIATRLTGRGDWDKLFADHDNIWFVAHSMGGLVLKRALLQTDQFSKRPLSRVRGALFLGTPAKGAELANLVNELESRGLGGEWIARALGFNPAQVRELASDNTWLDQLEQDWSVLHGQRKASPFPFFVYCAYEEKPEYDAYAFTVTVVDKLHASSTCEGRMFPINEKHTMLPKPADASSDAHDWLKGRIRWGMDEFERAELVQRSRRTSIQILIETMKSESHPRGDPSSLPVAPESLWYDPEVLNLYLKRRDYAAPNWWTLWLRIARDHPCLKVGVDERRREVQLQLEGAVDCPAGAGLACRPTECP